MKKKMPFFLLALAFLIMACSITFNLGNAKPASPPSNPNYPSLPTATLFPSPTFVISSPTPPPTLREITVYFMDENRFIAGTEPYEVAVTRTTTSDNLPLAVLEAYFAGPAVEEYQLGLRMLGSGFTTVRQFSIEDGIARVYLGGTCTNNGAAYSVAALIMKNLSQFPEISAVKIYDENNDTLDPDSQYSSLPYCLEP
ncbi:MAG: GerMN domain-containing protein [Anaerolineaceae bacterium]|nr:GerMN domain-containing protein [Anaerolineaceae bacterium]